MDDLTVERVLRTVESIPRGRVASYGQVGDVCGVGPRLVGRIMSQWGSGVTWWRVTSADGDLPAPLLARALDAWDEEGIALKPNGRGCRIARYRADHEQLVADARRAWADLPEE
ncbi:MGMT family protein [Brachybacterium kimchii]|uniref:MGMT family protein n=1 Tax=Brachybacterium kimchii TaxID=2942909 RepID=A0ABY4N1N9_9MICO|nr:MGMT family protein [Brachybacterium kimchii]UQN28059.1 MGMT family protein [Brachybacterium kimchii]